MDPSWVKLRTRDLRMPKIANMETRLKIRLS